MENENQIHTILGAGGSVGNALTKELLDNGRTVRLVSRSGFSWHGTESMKADVSSLSETIGAVRGSHVVFLCIGLPYDTKVWRELWPGIMTNTIEACRLNGAQLIFLDNVYSYGRVEGKMTETTTYNPCSRKGEIRARIASRLEQEIKQGNIQAIIARAADWYGPYATKSSIPYFLVFEKLVKGKKAAWLIDAFKAHSYSYTLDCARGLSLLAARPEAFNQTWHLPTTNPGIDGNTFIGLAAKELGEQPRYTVLKKWMVRIAGFSDKTIAEAHEMLYQSEFEYCFDSSKFEQYFQYIPTAYDVGIRETVQWIRKQAM
jgi:nucleoside-diphosphate-sugar epimerase